MGELLLLLLVVLLVLSVIGKVFIGSGVLFVLIVVVIVWLVARN